MAASLLSSWPASFYSPFCLYKQARISRQVPASGLSPLLTKPIQSSKSVVYAAADLRHLQFAGLKMSSTEGLAKRVRDPQIVADETTDTVKKSRNYVSAQISKPGVKSLIVAVVVPLVLGSIDAFFNSPSSTWFSNLKKPFWEPPGFIFGGAWSILYPLMGLASWLVWCQGGFEKQGRALTLYAVQLVLNLLWPLFFFGWKNLSLALVDILALLVVLVLTIGAFKPANQLAANLLKPYLAWIVFATALNINLLLNNRGSNDSSVQPTSQ